LLRLRLTQLDDRPIKAAAHAGNHPRPMAAAAAAEKQSALLLRASGFKRRMGASTTDMEKCPSVACCHCHQCPLGHITQRLNLVCV